MYVFMYVCMCNCVCMNALNAVHSIAIVHFKLLLRTSLKLSKIHSFRLPKNLGVFFPKFLLSFHIFLGIAFKSNQCCRRIYKIFYTYDILHGIVIYSNTTTILPLFYLTFHTGALRKVYS